MLLKNHAFALVLALAALPACQTLLPSGPTNVAQGRYYSTGEPEYDDFFLRVYRLQLKLKDAPTRIGEPRQKVADSLEVGPDPEDLRVALAKRAKDLQNRGIRFTVARPESPDKPPTLLVTGNPTGKDFELRGLLEAALKSAGELKLDVLGWTKELDELSARQTTLDGNVPEAFASRSEGQRTDVKNNLSDAQKIITLLGERTRDLDHATSDFLKAVTSALGETQVDTKAESTADATSEPEKKEKPAKPAKPTPSKPAPKGKASAKPAPAPKPAPAQKPTPKPAAAPAAKPAAPKPAAEATPPPAPKPTQGTAKPDFEP
jgi:hypothetical protein